MHGDHCEQGLSPSEGGQSFYIVEENLKLQLKVKDELLTTEQDRKFKVDLGKEFKCLNSITETMPRSDMILISGIVR